MNKNLDNAFLLMLFFSVNLLLFGSKSYAETVCNSPNAQIVDYGLYEAVKGEKVEAEDVIGGYNTVIYGKKLIAKTTDVTGEPGVQFGFRYSLSCENPDVRFTPVMIKVLHPKMTNPVSGQESRESSWTDWAWTFQNNIHAGWSFDEPWEVAPGEFRIQVILDGNILAEKKFNVSAPKDSNSRRHENAAF